MTVIRLAHPRDALSFAVLLALVALPATAQDVTVVPPANGGFSVRNAADNQTLLRVDDSGEISLPGVAARAAQAGVLCFDAASGALGPCEPGAITGPVGPVGPMGPSGATGPAGVAGPQGEAGPAGPTGAIGPAGPIGPAGDTGDTGVAGPAGPIGPQGAEGPIGATGVAGPAGPAGPQGPQGPEGPIGPVGTTGAVGATGPVGPIGPIGPEGPTGPEGPEGAVGPAGPIGPAGPVGAEGPTGPQGPVGPVGAVGATGDTGGQGPQGPVGPQGIQGPIGPTGATGPAGTYTIGTGLELTGSTLSLTRAGCTAGQVLQYDGTVWSCVTPASGAAFDVLLNGTAVPAPGMDYAFLGFVGANGLHSSFLTSTNYRFTVKDSGGMKALWISYTGAGCTGTAGVSFYADEPDALSAPGLVFRNGASVFYIPANATLVPGFATVSFRSADAAGTCTALTATEPVYTVLANNPAVTGYNIAGNPNTLTLQFQR